MDWPAAAMITFSAVAANHLRLVAAVEKVIRHRLPIVNCPKCATFWGVLIYGALTVRHFVGIRDMVEVLAVAFLCAYLSLWVNLLFAIIDHFFNKIYDSLFTTTDTAADGAEHTAGTLPVVPEQPDGTAGRSGTAAEA